MYPFPTKRFMASSTILTPNSVANIHTETLSAFVPWHLSDGNVIVWTQERADLYKHYNNIANSY